MSKQSKNPETIALHGGDYRSDPAATVAVPIYRTTSYQFNNTGHAANLFALKEFGNIYTRLWINERCTREKSCSFRKWTCLCYCWIRSSSIYICNCKCVKKLEIILLAQLIFMVVQ